MAIKHSLDHHFMQLAYQASTNTGCLATPVGAVIAKDGKKLSAGCNTPPPSVEPCTKRGYCYPGVEVCSKSMEPSRAIHAEANAIAKAARIGIPIEGATIYTTLEPCLNCLKLIIGAGIVEIVFAEKFAKHSVVGDEFVKAGVVKKRWIGPR
jgi:dCMP deaminase